MPNAKFFLSFSKQIFTQPKVKDMAPFSAADQKTKGHSCVHKITCGHTLCFFFFFSQSFLISFLTQDMENLLSLLIFLEGLFKFVCHTVDLNHKAKRQSEVGDSSQSLFHFYIHKLTGAATKTEVSCSTSGHPHRWH